jgi:hypothetical protein
VGRRQARHAQRQCRQQSGGYAFKCFHRCVRSAACARLPARCSRARAVAVCLSLWCLPWFKLLALSCAKFHLRSLRRLSCLRLAHQRRVRWLYVLLAFCARAGRIGCGFALALICCLFCLHCTLARARLHCLRFVLLALHVLFAFCAFALGGGAGRRNCPIGFPGAPALRHL